MSVNEIIMAVMAFFAVIGALDRIFGCRLGIGKEFEKGMMQADSVMQQLEGFMESTGMSMEEMTDEEMTMEVEQLIDVTGAAEVDPMDDEIDRRLSQLEQKKSALKE